jgi:biotin-independent malonate decarboxylase beta subunit
MSNLLQTHELDWYEASARERIAGLLDPKSFGEFLGPEQRAMSPHLAQFDLTGAFDDGIVVGRGRLDGQMVFVAAQEGRFLGGAFGEVHGAKLLGLLRAARDGAGRPRTGSRKGRAAARYRRRSAPGGECRRARDLRDHPRHP